jgi:hypothetical protein
MYELYYNDTASEAMAYDRRGGLSVAEIYGLHQLIVQFISVEASVLPLKNGNTFSGNVVENLSL